MAPACAVDGVATPSGTPLILRRGGRRWRSGSSRGQPSWSGVLRCVTIDLDDEQHTRHRRRRRVGPDGEPARLSRHPGADPRRRRRRARPPPRVPGAVGARRASCSRRSSAASASSSTPASGGCCRPTPASRPTRPGSRAPPAAAAAPAGSVGSTDVGPAIALAALGLGAILLLEAVLGRGAVFWPLVIGVVGIALLWRQADEAQRERWLDSTGRIDPMRIVFGDGGWASYARVAAGVGADRAGAGPLLRQRRLVRRWPATSPSPRC